MQTRAGTRIGDLRCLVWGLLLLGPIALSSCSKDGSTGPEGDDGDGGFNAPAVASIERVAGDLQSGTVGTPVEVRPTVRLLDAFGAAVVGRTVTFSVASGGGSVTGASQRSGNDGTATVGSWLLGTIPGSNQLLATVLGGPSVVFVATAQPQGIRIRFENQLVRPVTITIAGVGQGTVSAQSVREIVVPPSGTTIRAEFALVRGTTAQGTPVGETMSGYWDLPPTSTNVNLVIDNLVGSTWYFAPTISNQTGVNLLLMVNGGLVSETRCNCVVSAGQTNVHIGYYRLFSNSNVRAYRESSGYTGSYRYFYDFAQSITAGTGRRDFTFTIAP